MDPTECAVMALRHYVAGRLTEARAARNDLAGWIACGGFRPVWSDVAARYQAGTGEYPPPSRFARSIRAACAGEEDSREGAG